MCSEHAVWRVLSVFKMVTRHPFENVSVLMYGKPPRL